MLHVFIFLQSISCNLVTITLNLMNSSAMDARLFDFFMLRRVINVYLEIVFQTLIKIIYLFIKFIFYINILK